jgi:hypothetical protein
MNSKWQFEEFDAGPVSQSTDRIHVTISPKGCFYLNGRAIKALDEPDAVVLFYDRRLQTIAMKRAPISKRNAYRLRPKDGEKVTSRILHAANFCKHYNIKPSSTVAFLNPSVDDGLLILSLHEVATVNKK